VISIDPLSDDVLLEIFDYYVKDEDKTEKQREEAWQSLVHVCCRWRSIVFGSPHHLNLQLVCTERTPARDTLDVWPTFPLVIWCDGFYRTANTDNVIAVLERRDRVCQIHLARIQSSDLEIFLAAMQQPFPELTHLRLRSFSAVRVDPDSFLGGSAPRLEFLMLDRVPFPGLPKLLLSAVPHLTSLYLENIPHSGCISPEAMVTALSSLASLEYLTLNSPRSCPDQASRRPPPSTRTFLFVLTFFSFEGVSEYLEDLVARIDAPRLSNLYITLFNDIVLDTPQLMQFISRAPTSRALEKANIALRNRLVSLDFSSRTSGAGNVHLAILCQGLDWQLSTLEQVCTSYLPPLSMLEDLYTYEDRDSQPDSKDSDDIENWLWLQLLHPFVAVKNLYLSEQFALRIGPALRELVGGRTMDVLPALQNISLKGLQPSGPVQEGIRQFVASRQATGRPIAVSRWDDLGSEQDDSDSEQDEVLTWDD
jgi:hypothetical protein